MINIFFYRIKDKIPGINKILNNIMRLLINESSTLLTRIFQIYLDLKVYLDYFKRAFTVILRKLSKADYSNLLTY